MRDRKKVNLNGRVGGEELGGGEGRETIIKIYHVYEIYFFILTFSTHITY